MKAGDGHASVEHHGDRSLDVVTTSPRASSPRRHSRHRTSGATSRERWIRRGEGGFSGWSQCKTRLDAKLGCTISAGRFRQRCMNGSTLRRISSRRFWPHRSPERGRWHLQQESVSRPAARRARTLRRPHQGADKNAVDGGPVDRRPCFRALPLNARHENLLVLTGRADKPIYTSSFIVLVNVRKVSDRVMFLAVMIFLPCCGDVPA